MKIYISFFAILIFAVSIFGQRRQIAYRTTFSKEPFSLDIDKLPANYPGNDAEQVFNLLAAIKEESKCGKFERTDDCQSRINKLYDRPLWSGVTAKDNFAFSISIDDCDYSADDEILRCPKFKSVLQGFSSQYTWSHKTISSSTYIAQNGFGVKKKVLYKKIENIHINYGESGKADFTLKNISPAEARKLIPKLRLLLVGSPISPLVKQQLAVYEPTLSDPVKTEGDNKTIYIDLKSIILYDFESGIIYKRTS